MPVQTLLREFQEDTGHPSGFFVGRQCSLCWESSGEYVSVHFFQLGTERYAGAPSPTVERCLGQVIPLKRDFRVSQASFMHSSGLASGIHLIVADPTLVVPVRQFSCPSTDR